LWRFKFALGSSVFTLLGQVSEYAAFGQFTTDANGDITVAITASIGADDSVPLDTIPSDGGEGLAIDSSQLRWRSLPGIKNPPRKLK
jgi:hypothetical protein